MIANETTELGNHTDVSQVVVLGGLGQLQVMQHQPGDQLAVVVGQAEALAEAPREVLAELGMIATATLGNIVIKQRDIQQLGALQGRHQFGGQRHGDEAPFAQTEVAQDIDGANGVRIDRVLVIAIELTVTGDAAEIRDQASEHAGLMHLAQRSSHIARRTQNGEQHVVGPQRNAQRSVDPPRVFAHDAQGATVEIASLLLRFDENTDQIVRIGGKRIDVVHTDFAAIHLDATVQLLASPKSSHRADLLFEMQQENVCQIGDGAHVQKIILEKALDRARTLAVAIAKTRGDFRLQIEAQPIGLAAGHEMHGAAHPPQKIPAAHEAVELGIIDQALADQLARGRYAIPGHRQPENSADVAQCTLAVLEFGLHDEGGVALGAAASGAFLELQGAELDAFAFAPVLLAATLL